MWIAGYNNPGYMPETDPEAFETFEEAQDYLTYILDQFVDDWDVGESDGDEYNRAIHFIQSVKPASITVNAGRYAFWIEENNQ
jgi:hypothetical protein